MDFRIPFFRGIPYFVPYSVFTRKKLNFAKFRGLPYSIFWRNSVFCSVFRFYVEKIKFREILWTSVFRFFAEFRILFRIPFLRGKNQIPRNFAEFRIPCSIFISYFSAKFRKKYETETTEFRWIPCGIFQKFWRNLFPLRN